MGTAKKDDSRRKVITAQETKAQDKENKRTGEKTKNHAEKIYEKMTEKIKTPLKEQSGSAVMPMRIKSNKTN